MSSGFSPDLLVLHECSRLLVGEPLNGFDLSTANPPWRGLLIALGAAAPSERAAVLAGAFAAWGMSPPEVAEFHRLVAPLDPRQEVPAPESAPIRILTGDALLEERPLTYLIQGMLPENCFATIVGETNKGKTFCAFDMAARVAQNGRPVLYIVAEGQRGIAMRYRSWREYYNGGEAIPNLHFITQPIFPTEADMMADLYASMEIVGCPAPSLTIFDTLSMCFIGDENTTEAMKAYIDGLTRYRLRTTGAVLSIVHTGWDTTRMGGNRKLQNATDVEMRVEQDEFGTITLSCTKMRDGDKFLPRYFRLQGVTDTESCVIIPTNVSPEIKVTMPETHTAVLAALEKADTAGLSLLEIVEQSGVTRKKTVSDILKVLERAGLVYARGEKGQLGRRYFYRDPVR